jgi:DNA-binding GntR family transcriptional regulator
MTNRRVSLADFVFSQLEEDILSERYQTGQVLTELAVCEQMQVSRTPVREAFRRLQQEGYLTESGRGNLVVGTSPRDMLDVYEIRLRTEGLATGWAAARITDEGLKELADTIDLQEFYTARQDADHIQEQDSLFHRLIFAHCGSPILGDMLTALHRRIQRYRTCSVQDRLRAGKVIDEHKAIYRALSRHDAESAEYLALQHVKNAREHIGAEETLWACQ